MCNDRIILIFDPHFGEKLRPLATSSPIWIINSSDNDAVAHDLWKSKVGNITTFKPAHFTDLIDTVDEHHYGWKELEVIGETLTENASASVSRYTAAISIATEDGFFVKR
jgi:hypothetical protein